MFPRRILLTHLVLNVRLCVCGLCMLCIWRCLVTKYVWYNNYYYCYEYYEYYYEYYYYEYYYYGIRTQQSTLFARMLRQNRL